MDDSERTELLTRIARLERDLAEERARGTASVRAAWERSGAAVAGDPADLVRGLACALHEAAVVGFDREGRYLFIVADPGLAERYGVDLEIFAGKNLSDVFPPDVAAHRLAQTEHIFATGATLRETYAFDTPRGRFWHDISLAPMRDERGVTKAVLGILFDITERRQVEVEAQESGRLYRSVVEQVGDGILLLGRGTVLYANPAAHTLFGYPATSGLVGRPIDDLFGSEARDVHQRLVAPVAEHGLVEHLCLTAEGRRFTAELSARTVQYERQPVLLCVVRDVTQRKESERARQLLDERMQQAQRQESLTVLAGGVAHDFNNLLMSVLVNASLIQRQLPPDSPLRSRVDAIETAAERAADLTRQLRAYSVGDASVAEPVNVAELLGEMTSLVGASISKLVQVRYALDGELPALHADATQLRQVVMNLVVNAAEAIGERDGTVLLRTELVSVTTPIAAYGPPEGRIMPGEYVSIEVTDDGCGMDALTRARIFEPFFSTKLAGRGLGLAAVLGIVRSHHGGLIVESTPGTGSTFRLLLPTEGRRPGAASGVRPAPSEQRGSGVILVVDDEEGVRATVRLALEYLGFQVLTAVDGLDAIRVFHEQSARISAVLLDLTMPHLDGAETLRRMRAIRADVPIVLSSGFGEEESLTRLGGQAVEGFFQKPYRLDALAAQLLALVSRGASQTG